MYMQHNQNFLKVNKVILITKFCSWTPLIQSSSRSSSSLQLKGSSFTWQANKHKQILQKWLKNAHEISFAFKSYPPKHFYATKLSALKNIFLNIQYCTTFGSQAIKTTIFTNFVIFQLHTQLAEYHSQAIHRMLSTFNEILISTKFWYPERHWPQVYWLT